MKFMILMMKDLRSRRTCRLTLAPKHWEEINQTQDEIASKKKYLDGMAKTDWDITARNCETKETL